MNLGLLGPSSYRKGPTGAIEAIGAIGAKGAIEKSNLFICHSHHGRDLLAGMLPEYMIVVAVGDRPEEV